MIGERQTIRRVFAFDGRAVIQDVPTPVLRRGEVLVATLVSTVSTGTELMILGRSARPGARDDEYPGDGAFTLPKIRSGLRPEVEPRSAEPGLFSLGYSLAGRVVAVGDGVEDLTPGDLVACSGSQCAHHAEIVAIPRNLVVAVPDGVRICDAAFVTLGAIAMEAVRQTGCGFGETIVVYGLGLLGLLAAQIARSAGLYVIGLEIDERRRELATEMGIAECLDPREPEARNVVLSRTDGFGADGLVLSVATESNEPVNQAFELCRQRAQVVGLGVFGLTLDRDRMWDRTLVQTMAYGPGRYDPAYEEGCIDYPIGYVRWTENRNMAHFLRLLAEGAVRVAPLAPQRFPVAEARTAYDTLLAPSRPPTVQFEYDGYGQTNGGRDE